MAPDGSANGLIADMFTRHGLDLLRVEAGQRKKIRALLNELQGDLVAQLARIDPTGPARQSYRAKRLEKLLAQTKDTIRASYRGASRTMAGELRELADIEVGFAARAINEGIGMELATATLTRAQTSALVGDVLVQGAPVAEWWSRQAGDTLKRFQDAMRGGVAQGDTNAQLIQRIRGGIRNGEQVTGFMDISRRNADSLVRAATQAVAERAKQSTYDANADILAATVWTATLDQRTTTLCAVRDGLRYTVTDHEPIGHGVPWLEGPGQIHWGCRSSSRPETKSWKELGFDIDELPPTTRASMDGQVAADTKFEDWLSKRPKAEQNEMLGTGRADLWRDGTISFRDLLDANGRELSLTELRALSPKPKPRVKPKPKVKPKTLTPNEQRAAIWENKTTVEQQSVAPAFSNAEPSRLAVIERAGELSGGVKRGNGSHHRSSNMSIQMDSGRDGEAYQRVMRHEYGHHIDARIERIIMEKNGVRDADVLGRATGPSRLANAEMAADAKVLEGSVSMNFRNAWTHKPANVTPGFDEVVGSAQSKLQRKFRAVERAGDDVKAAIHSEFAKRNLDYDEVRTIFPHMFTEGSDIVRARTDSAAFLAAFDAKDHVSLVYRGGITARHASPLAGLSDSIGAVTNQRLGYAFGHPESYYKKFRAHDRKVARYYGDKIDTFGSGPKYPTKGRYAYGTGNSAQVWANWFEAYTSGSETQYTVFKQMFPKTSAKFEKIVKEFVSDGTVS